MPSSAYTDRTLRSICQAILLPQHRESRGQLICRLHTSKRLLHIAERNELGVVQSHFQAGTSQAIPVPSPEFRLLARWPLQHMHHATYDRCQSINHQSIYFQSIINPNIFGEKSLLLALIFELIPLFRRKCTIATTIADLQLWRISAALWAKNKKRPHRLGAIIKFRARNCLHSNCVFIYYSFIEKFPIHQMQFNERIVKMEVPDDLKSDSGLKTRVRDAVRPQLAFIKASLKEGVSEAAVHRYLIKHGHLVGSRSGFGAALKYLLQEEQSVVVVGAPADRSSLAAVPVPPHSVKPAAPADVGAAEASVPVHSPAKTSYGDERHGLTWGTA